MPAFPPSPLLKDLAPAEAGRVLAAGSRRAVAGGAVLVAEGEPAEALFAVQSGRLRLTQLSPDGQEVVVRFTTPGDVFGGLAVLDGKSYPFTAAAVEPSQVVAWRRAALLQLFAQVPRLQRNVLDIVGGHGREMLDRVRELSTEPVPRRLARAVLRLLAQGEAQADGVLLRGVTQQDLARMAGTTLFTASRTLAEWQREGVVKTGRGRLLVRDARALTALAGEPSAG